MGLAKRDQGGLRHGMRNLRTCSKSLNFV